LVVVNVVVRCLSENTNSGIFVSESLSSGQPIPVRRSTVVAFLGSALRGPVGIPVSVGSVDEYLKRFGVPGGCDSPLIDAVRQFFMNGGVTAIIVRVCSSARRHHIDLPGPLGVLTLEAINPGAHELLRASIDYDGIPSKDKTRFNLVIHRLAARDRPIVVQQEVYRGLSVDMADTDFIGYALLGSELVGVKGKIPEQRPDVTFRSGIEVNSAYIYVDPDWPETDCLTDYDLIGCDTEGTGLFALNQVPSVDLVNLLPDASDLGPVALFTAERYCRERNAILLVDPPTHWQGADDAIRHSRESGFASPNIAMYFPRPTVSGKPSASALGAISGALAARDAHDGAWGPGEKAPLEMRGLPKLSVDLDIEEQYALKQVGINALRRTGPSRFELTGLVTLNRGSGCVTEWDDLCLRRTVLIIIDSIIRGTRWAAFQDNDSGTCGELCRQVKRYLCELYTNGALSGENTENAGYCICDKQTIDGETGVSFVIGFMPLEYGMQSIRFHQRPDECQVQMLHIKHSIALAS
jgi:hypothetical protein